MLLYLFDTFIQQFSLTDYFLTKIIFVKNNKSFLKKNYLLERG